MRRILLVLLVAGIAAAAGDQPRSVMADFAVCMAGPDCATPHGWGMWCERFDIDYDDNIDLADWAFLQNEWGNLGGSSLGP